MSMSRHGPEHLAELLADEATCDLAAADTAVLARLGAARHGTLREAYHHAATVTQLAFLREDARATRQMPERLRARLATQAATFSRGQAAGAGSRPPPPLRRAVPTSATAPPPAPARAWQGVTGWLMAAALAIAFIVWRPAATPQLAPAAQRSQLLAEAPDVLTLPWSRPDTPGFEGVTGDVVWSASRQAGFLRLAGMPRNDPAVHQYQLWIIDPDRDTHPVDGGVFDVTTEGQVIIPVTARLPVGTPQAFAITREKPGGVVVSAGPLLVVASG